MKQLKYNTGQAALIIILITAVVVTIVASTVGRTATDVRLSTQTEEQLQAQNAADTGVEAALWQFNDRNVTPAPLCDQADSTSCTINHDGGELTQSRYWYTFTDWPTAGQTEFDLGPIPLGETRTILLSNDPTDLFPIGGTSEHFVGTLDVGLEWTTNDNKIEFQYLYDNSGSCDGSDVVMYRDVHEITSVDHDSTYTIDTDSPAIFNDCVAYVRIRPIQKYLDTVRISVPAGFSTDFPQGVLIDARGEYLGSGVGSQSITKRIQYVRLHEAPPAFSDFLLFAGNGIDNIVPTATPTPTPTPVPPTPTPTPVPTSTPVPPTPTPDYSVCVDTDGGDKPFIPGKVITTAGTTIYDNCVWEIIGIEYSNVLREMTCGYSGGSASQLHTCANGCVSDSWPHYCRP